jgi:hypothetical protein
MPLVAMRPVGLSGVEDVEEAMGAFGHVVLLVW